MQTTELRKEAALRSRAVIKNVLCGLVTPEKVWTLGRSSSARQDVVGTTRSRHGQTYRRESNQENGKNDKSLRIRAGLNRSYVNNQS